MLKNWRTYVVKKGPSLLAFPLRLTPFVLKKHVLEQLFQWQFKQALKDGELEFLRSHWLKVEIEDLGLTWFVTLQEQQILVAQQADADVIFRGQANDLILIATQKEDPDTLFFQRRLIIEGDTELGLYIKNLMNTIELSSMPILLRTPLLQLANFIEQGTERNSVEIKRETSC